MIYFAIDYMSKNSSIKTLAIFVCVFGCWNLMFMFSEDYIFQDSSEDCKNGLREKVVPVLAIVQVGYLLVFMFIAFQQILAKFCVKH